jgi:hypothetical protein
MTKAKTIRRIPNNRPLPILEYKSKRDYWELSPSRPGGISRILRCPLLRKCRLSLIGMNQEAAGSVFKSVQHESAQQIDTVEVCGSCPHGPRFRVLEIFIFARDGQNAGVPSLTLRKNGADSAGSGGHNRLARGPGCGLLSTDQITFRTRLFDRVVRPAESQILRRRLARSSMELLCGQSLIRDLRRV